MQNYFKLSNIIPELIALIVVLNTYQLHGLIGFCLSLAIATILRFIWNSAIIVHGLGHTIAIAAADRKLLAVSLTNILEHQNISSILKSLLPFQPIFIPILSLICGQTLFPYLKIDNSERIKLKAIGGIILNILVAITFSKYFDSFFPRVLVVANLLIALSSVSDIKAFITGIADYLYCGNFGAIAIRRREDEQKLLPDRILDIAIQMGRETEIRGELMLKAGSIAEIKKMLTVDLLITGEENSLLLGEKFAQDLKIVFPLLNVVTISANQTLQELDRGLEQLNLDKDSLVLAITQSGQTFSTVQAIEVFDYLSSLGAIGELFVMAGELSSFINSTQGRGGLDISDCSSLDSNGDCQASCDTGRSTASTPAKKHRCRIFVNHSGRRQAEPSTVAVAAALQTLTELLFYLAKQMRSNSADSNLFGMTLTQESLMVLVMMKEDFLSKNVSKIIGIDNRGKPIKSKIEQTLIQNGRYWANHITETPLAWAIHALYILISVGWTIPFGHTLPLVETISQSLFDLLSLPTGLIQFLSSVAILADIGIYIFGMWFWILAIRYFQNRQLLARMGKRTLVIADVSWVNQLLQAYVSKLFSLSYGIATMEVHSADPQNHLIHAFGHRIVRGTLIWLGIPDARHNKQHQKVQNAVIMTGKQANGVRNFNIGPEIIAVCNNRELDRQGFDKTLVLNSNDDSIYLRSATTEQKEQIEKLRESCFGSFERLLAGYVFFWALAKRVASLPFLRYEHWKSQSRTKSTTTAAPVVGVNIDKLLDKLTKSEQG